MRVKKTLVILLAVIMLTPALSFTTATTPVEENLSATNWDSPMGVEGGETLKYNIDQMILPSYLEIPENITLPDLNSTQLYVKIMAVEEGIEFDSNTEGTFVTLGLGFIFPEELAIGLAFDDLISTEVIIPAGAATPAFSMSGVPHFNTTFCGPNVFVLNLDWSEHEVLMEDMGLTIDNGVDDYVVTYDDPVLGGSMEGTWRKSDGVLTHMLYDNVVFMGMNMTDITLEINLESMEMKGLDLYEGQVINMNAEQIDLEIDMTGDFEQTPYVSSGSTFLPFADQLQEYIDPMLGQTVERFVIDEIEGTFYKASLYMWDIEEEKLERMDEQIIFNGFLYAIPGDHIPMMYSSIKDSGFGFWPGPGMALTPDWDIYDGELMLMNTVAGVYLTELFEAFGPPEYEGKIHTVGAGIELTHSNGYYYFEEGMNGNYDQNHTASISLQPQGYYDVGENYNVTQSLWMAYTETGIWAGMELHASGVYTAYDDNDLLDEGTITFNIDVRLVNPDYNPAPPAPAGTTGGFPGFTLMIAIPIIASLGIGITVYRKKRQ